VTRSYSLDPQLGTWVDTQRAVFKKGKMDFERKAKLNKIGFELSGEDEADEENWNSQFIKLQDYHVKHGHCELIWAVGRLTVTFEEHPALTLHLPLFLSPCIAGKVPTHYSLDPQLGRWVRWQRGLFKSGRVDVERKAKLDEIGFEFSVKSKLNEEKWNLQFKKLQDYYGNHGHCELIWAVGRLTVILEYLH
jgi:hypothetical protein